MSLRTRILVLLCSVVVVFMGLDLLAARSLVRTRFDSIERTIADERLGSALLGLEAELDSVDTIARNLAAVAANTSSNEQLHGPANLAECDLELVMLCDRERNVLSLRLESPRTREPMDLVDFPGERLSPAHPLLVDELGRPRPDDHHGRGLLVTDGGTMIVASAPFGRIDGTGGRVFAGRFLTNHLLSRIEQESQVSLAVFPLDQLGGADLTEEVQESLLTLGTGEHFDVVEKDRIHQYRMLTDVRGFPLLIARVSSLRDITALGIRSANDTLLSTTAVAVLLLLTLMKVLQKLVVAPLAKLTTHATDLGTSDGPTTRLNSTRGDEIGILSRELDRMVDDLERVRHENVEIAHRAGLSDAAARVLHGVGNSLNNLTVATGVLSSLLDSLPATDLKPVVEALEAHKGDLDRYLAEDVRGQHLLPYLRSISERLQADKELATTELVALLESVAKIESLVEAQRQRTNNAMLLEWSSLDQLITRTVDGCRKLDEDFERVLINHDFAELPRFRVDRHRFLDVVMNLVLNAAEALRDADPETASIVLRLRETASGSALVEVQDNGAGIAPEDLDQVFRPGFTTRGEGRGFGLHEAANAAREMDCNLTVRSDGPGKGATFVLEIPAANRAPSSRAA